MPLRCRSIAFKQLFAVCIALLNGCGPDANAPQAEPNAKKPEHAESRPEPEDSWGPVVSGLQTKIHFLDDQNSFSPEQPIQIQFAIRNASKVDRIIIHGGFWPDNRVDVYHGDTLATLTELGERLRAAFRSDIREKTVPVTLMPDETDSSWPTIDLTTLYDLSQSGNYRVLVVHRANPDVTSNELTFEIKAK